MVELMIVNYTQPKLDCTIQLDPSDTKVTVESVTVHDMFATDFFDMAPAELKTYPKTTAVPVEINAFPEFDEMVNHVPDVATLGNVQVPPAPTL